MYSVNPFGDSTLSFSLKSIATPPECPWIALKYEMCLEELGLKQYWNLFLPPPIDIQSFSDHGEAPSNFSFLHSSKTSSNRTAPSISRGTVRSCRSNRVMAFDTWQHVWSWWSLCFNVYPCSVTYNNRNGRQRHCGLQSWSSFGNKSHRSTMPFLLGLHRFCNVLDNSAHDSNTRLFCLGTEIRAELQYCIDLLGDKLLCPRLDRFSYSWESIVSLESSFRFEASCILGINVASPALLLYQVWRSIIRQSSNQRQSIVWIITSGHRTIVRICSQSLAPGFPVAVRWYGCQQNCCPHTRMYEDSPWRLITRKLTKLRPWHMSRLCDTLRFFLHSQQEAIKLLQEKIVSSHLWVWQGSARPFGQREDLLAE